MIKIAVTGPRGRLGSELVRRDCIPLDLSITQDVAKLYLQIDYFRPDVIINCAAYTKVDLCETVEGLKEAILVNTRGAENLLRNPNRSYRLIHLSTDYIFSGQHGPYGEKSKDYRPVNGYGYSKLGGDVLVQTEPFPQKDTIVRTTGLYGGSDDFVGHELMVLKEVGSFDAVDNLFGNQTYIPDLADGLLELARLEHPPKILNIASKEVVSRYEFAKMVARMGGYSDKVIRPIKSSEVPLWKAKRPVYGGLKVDLAESLEIPIYPIISGLQKYFKGYSHD